MTLDRARGSESTRSASGVARGPQSAGRAHRGEGGRPLPRPRPRRGGRARARGLPGPEPMPRVGERWRWPRARAEIVPIARQKPSACVAPSWTVGVDARVDSMWRWAIAFGVGMAFSCAGSSVFVCGSDEECSGGRCETNGYCSFPDDDCASGWVYGDLSAPQLAGECVDGEDGSTGTTMGPPGEAEVTTGNPLPPPTGARRTTAPPAVESTPARPPPPPPPRLPTPARRPPTTA